MKNRSIRGAFAASIAFAMLLLMSPASADDRGGQEERRPDVLTNRQVLTQTGRSIAEWGAEWWQWAFDHPEVLGDTTGKFGPLGDVGGPVFFALGSVGDPVRAKYEVPGGQYILLPVATYIWTFFDPCVDVVCAREIVNRNFIDGIRYVSVQIDGEPVRNMNAQVVRVGQRNPLIFQVDAGPIQPDGYGGILNAVQGGYWLMLEPLPPGKHRISMFAIVPNLDPVTGEILGGHTALDAILGLQRRPRR